MLLRSVVKLGGEMTEDKAANHFIEDIKNSLSEASAAVGARATVSVTAHFTIKRMVGCTFIVGQQREPEQRRRPQRAQG